MKNLKLTPSRIENTLVCFFYGTLSYENGDKEGKICVANSNAGASINIVKVSKDDFFLLKEGKNGIEKKKYLTIGIHTKDVKKASAAFQRLDLDINNRFKSIKSEAISMPIDQRLEILYNIYNPDHQGEFLTHKKNFGTDGSITDEAKFDFDNMRSMGLDIKDIIAPSSNIKTFLSFLSVIFLSSHTSLNVNG